MEAVATLGPVGISFDAAHPTFKWVSCLCPAPLFSVHVSYYSLWRSSLHCRSTASNRAPLT